MVNQDNKQKDGDVINIPGQKLDDAAARVLEASLGRIVDGVSEVSSTLWGGLIGDRLGEWRTRNFIDGLQKTAEHLRKKGIDLNNCRALPNSEMYALFEGTSKQDESDLQELWTALLANSLDPNGKPFRRQFTHILEQLEPSDARLFKFIVSVERFEKDHRKRQPEVPNDIFHTDKSAEADRDREIWNNYYEELSEFRIAEFKKMNIERSDCDVPCGRLVRLGLLERSQSLRNHYWPNSDGLEEVFSGLQDTANVLSEIHSGKVEISVFNAFLHGSPDPNFTPTDLGWELAKTCIV